MGEIDKVDLIKNFTSLPKKFKKDGNTNYRLEKMFLNCVSGKGLVWSIIRTLKIQC